MFAKWCVQCALALGCAGQVCLSGCGSSDNGGSRQPDQVAGNANNNASAGTRSSATNASGAPNTGMSAGGRSGSTVGGASIGSAHATGASAGSTSRGSGGSSTTSVQTSAGTSAIETYPRPCADVYDPNTVPTFNVEIAQSEWDAIVAGCEAKDQTYHPITFHYGAEAQPAMIRLKGNWSWDCNKMQFQISFNESDKQGRFHGLRKLVLDAPSYDETLLRERLGFSLMRDLGTPFSCANNARLEINGKYYGLFVNLERVDAGYLKRQFAESNGNLYKEGRELTTNEETGDTASVDAFWAASTVAELDALVDLEEAVLVWAGLAMAPDADSYWAGVEINVYLYQHPTRGLLFIPYDMDTAFQRCATCDPITYEHSQWKRELQYQVVMSDTRWCTAFETALRRARRAYDVAELKRRIETWSGQIAAALAADPNRTFSEQEAADSLASLRSLIDQRAAFIDAWLAEGSHCPPVWPTSPYSNRNGSRASMQTLGCSRACSCTFVRCAVTVALRQFAGADHAMSFSSTFAS